MRVYSGCMVDGNENHFIGTLLAEDWIQRQVSRSFWDTNPDSCLVHVWNSSTSSSHSLDRDILFVVEAHSQCLALMLCIRWFKKSTFSIYYCYGDILKRNSMIIHVIKRAPEYKLCVNFRSHPHALFKSIPIHRKSFSLSIGKILEMLTWASEPSDCMS